MKCLRCGHCCNTMMIVIVIDPELGLVENNVKGISNERCPHLLGDKPGEYSCAIHDRPYYKDLPCAEFTQVEEGNTDCRLGGYYLASAKS